MSLQESPSGAWGPTLGSHIEIHTYSNTKVPGESHRLTQADTCDKIPPTDMPYDRMWRHTGHTHTLKHRCTCGIHTNIQRYTNTQRCTNTYTDILPLLEFQETVTNTHTHTYTFTIEVLGDSPNAPQQHTPEVHKHKETCMHTDPKARTYRTERVDTQAHTHWGAHLRH